MSSNGRSLYWRSKFGESRDGCSWESFRWKYDIRSSNLRPDMMELKVSLRKGNLVDQ